MRYGGYMTIKSFVIILVLSAGLWYISRIVQALAEIYIFNRPSISLYPTSNIETGYPISLNLSSHDSNRYIYYFINIALWFLAIFGIQKLLFKKRSK